MLYSKIIKHIWNEMLAGLDLTPHEKKIGHRDCSLWAHGEFTVSSWWPKWSQPAVTKPWPGPWLSCDLAVTEPWSPWLSCDLAVTELWPSRDWAVTSLWPSLAVTEPWSLGLGAVTTVVTVSIVSSLWAHGDHLFSHGTVARHVLLQNWAPRRHRNTWMYLTIKGVQLQK